MLRWTLTAVMMLTAPAVAFGQEMNCETFLSNFARFNEKKEQFSSMPAMEITMGMIVGMKLGHQIARGERPDGNAGTEFVSTVAQSCMLNASKLVIDLAAEKLGGTQSAKLAKGKPTDEIGLTDLKLDIGKMRNRRVVVQGTISIIGDMAMLGNGGFDMTPVPIQLEKLPRDQRKALLEDCTTQCQVTVTGKVGQVLFQDGVIAESLTID